MVDFNRYIKGGDRYRDPTAPKPVPPTVPPVVIGITGHRPHKLATTGEHSGYDPYNALRVRIREEVKTATQSLINQAAVCKRASDQEHNFHTSSGLCMFCDKPRRSDRYANADHCASYLRQVKLKPG